MEVQWRDMQDGSAVGLKRSATSQQPLLPMISPGLPMPIRTKSRMLNRSFGLEADPEEALPPSPRSRLLEAAADVALRRTQSDPDFVKAERLKRTQLRERWQHPSPHPMGRAGEV